MTFSSPEFLFLFIPIFFFFYYISPANIRNNIIVIGSLAFYFVGAGYLTVVFLLSIIQNFFAGRMISSRARYKIQLLVLGVSLNLIPLICFKYGRFFLHSVNAISGDIGLESKLPLYSQILPLGISFYTFHGISYLVDSYRGKIRPSESFRDFTMYMINFPQLIAGPIVRYAEISDSIETRPVRVEQIFSGIVRFSLGLSKKLILADNLGAMADPIFALPGDELTRSVAWLGAVAYMLQIYYDFSGYSDMAIGLGRMMGFEFPENFNQPYRSQSVTEFWRRWHMTLSRWFRDYVYIPLGGNRAGPIRTYINLVVVFLLCGLWHGAAYAFVFWGVYHGFLLTIERLSREHLGVVPRGAPGQAMTILLVMIGWVFFRAADFGTAAHYLATMFSTHQNLSPIFGPSFYLTDDKILAISVGWVFALFPFEKLNRWTVAAPIAAGAQIFAVASLLIYSSALVAANGFNPFIYFRF
jgi:alginate O-acetyltransferase complex protein AlgI